MNSWKGELDETEEMRPQWFLYNEIPYDHMWADDVHWLPHALRGEKLRGRVWFQEDGKSIETMEWKKVDSF